MGVPIGYFCAVSTLIFASVQCSVASADYYNGSFTGRPYGSYWGQPQSAPIISLTLDPQVNLNSAFRIAAREERAADVDRFLDQKADINSHSETGETALMYAARNCSGKIIAQLIRRGADVNRVDELGRTALIFSVQASCVEGVYLLSRVPGIREDIRDALGKSALEYARDNAIVEVDGPSSKIIRILERVRSRSGLNGVLSGLVRQ